MKWKYLIVILLVIVVAIAAGYKYHWFSSNQAANSKELKTYYAYSSNDLDQLKNLSTSTQVTLEDINQITLVTYGLIRKDKLGDAYAARVFAYLYSAQRDAAFLAYQAKGQFDGNIEVISTRILCMFFANECVNGKLKDIYYEDDGFSDTVADIVFAKYQQRYKQELADTHLYPEKNGSEWWAGTRPYYGQDVGSWTPWVIQDANQFVAPAPHPPTDVAYWQQQSNITKTALKNITDDQIKKVVYWAGGPGTMTPPGIWLNIADEYMQAQNLSLQDTLWIHSQLAMGLIDACIEVFNSKYTYWIKRPNMQDPSIISIMPTPNHPSYPAGHSTISAAAATILSYYFPANKTQWWQLADAASYSRVWGGIHFQVDAQEGTKLGTNVGQTVIKSGK